MLILILLILGINSQFYINPNSKCSDDCNGVSRDSGFKTIQQAIDYQNLMNMGNFILLPGVYTGQGNTGIIINNGIYNIESNGNSTQTIIDCQNKSFGFILQNGVFGMNGLTFRNCISSDNGGALILKSGTYTLQDIVFQNNNASIQGGAVYVTSSTFNCKDCIFHNNNAQQAGGAYILSSAGTLKNIEIKNNTSSEISGGIYMKYSALTLENITVKSNQILNSDKIFTDTITGSQTGCFNSSLMIKDYDLGQVDMGCTDCNVTITIKDGSKINRNCYLYSDNKYDL